MCNCVMSACGLLSQKLKLSVFISKSLKSASIFFVIIFYFSIFEVVFNFIYQVWFGISGLCLGAFCKTHCLPSLV